MDPIDPIYLPFSSEVVKSHLAEADKKSHGVDGDSTGEKRAGVEYFEKSAKSYHAWLELDRQQPQSRAIAKLKSPWQIEKDEKFWTAGCLLAFAEKGGHAAWIELLRQGFGERPPIRGFGSWDDLLAGGPQLLLEAPLPSPQSYTAWLRTRLRERQLIPYVFEAAAEANPKDKLEGFTHADAILICKQTGFAVIFEAKVTADISYEVTFNLMRNQITRYVDVMLESPNEQSAPLSQRDPAKTLFALITPQMFKQNPRSRLYGRLMNEYKDHPETLLEDLPHRRDFDPLEVARRLGWVTWEQCEEVLPGACRWLRKSAEVAEPSERAA